MKLRIGSALAAAALSALAVAVVVSAQNGGTAATTNDAFFAALSGDNEVDSPGDKDGLGSFSATIGGGKRNMCFGLVVSDIGDVAAAHIHKAPKGKNGDIFLTLSTPPDGGGSAASGCAKTSKAKMNEILKKPSNFYVNVHTADFGGGAIRGQLFAKSP